MVYHLPSSPSYRCADRFSVCDTNIEEDANGEIPVWELLRALLHPRMSDASQLVDLLETIAVTLRGTSQPAGDYRLLRSVVDATPSFFSRIWPVLVSLALDMPLLFPDNALPVLDGTDTPTTSLRLTRRQTACLVVHQLLGTLSSPSWKEDGIYDFTIWYSSEQRHDTAPRAYLDSVFRYLDMVVGNPRVLNVPIDDWVVEYALYTATEPLGTQISPPATPLGPVELNLVPAYDTNPDSLGLPDGAAVVSANRFIGFGQSATQEEIHVGISPEACPAVLVTPPLRDRQVLVVRGAQAMTNVVGQRRDITVAPLVIDGEEEGPPDWRGRTMLFMDALEIDMLSAEEGLPDLLPENVEREIQKAVLAFSTGRYREVRTGLWGCGAFGGDPAVKMLALWCASSVAGVPLHIVCDPSLHEVGRDLAAIFDKAKMRLTSVDDLRVLLDSAPLSLKRLDTPKWLLQTLSSDG